MIKKNIMKFILKKLSRFIYYIYRIIDLTIPNELRLKPVSKLKLKLETNLVEETFDYFKNIFKKCII
jgi:hypothetical protein